MIIFTIFYLHRKVSLFLRKDSDCKDVDLYNTRKSYAVIDLVGNSNFWFQFLGPPL
jgi:hypothetical protein